MGFELFTKGMQDANEILNRNFAAVETQLNGMSIQLYVSINGSDESGDGTQDKPYRTIQKAVDAIKPYHTDASIIIGAGDYDESVEIRNKTASIGLSRETRENKVKLKYIGAAYCRQIWLDGLSFDGTGLEGDRPCINVMCVNNMQIHYCEIAGGACNRRDWSGFGKRVCGQHIDIKLRPCHYSYLQFAINRPWGRRGWQSDWLLRSQFDFEYYRLVFASDNINRKTKWWNHL